MLTERIGRGRATAALFSGAIIGSEEAGRIGLADRVADDALAAAIELAQLYATRETKLMADIKQSVRIASTSDLATSLEFESWSQAESMRNERFRTFMQRFAD
jgi:enoyl-CoA hydratase